MSSPYADPVELLQSALHPYSDEELARRFAPDGDGVFLQEVVDAARVTSMEDLLDSFSIDLDDPAHPRPEEEEWWVVFQWHPPTKQLIRGDSLRRRVAERASSRFWPADNG